VLNIVIDHEIIIEREHADVDDDPMSDIVISNVCTIGTENGNGVNASGANTNPMEIELTKLATSSINLCK